MAVPEENRMPAKKKQTQQGPDMTQSTVRLETAMLREAQHYFMLEDTNMTRFVDEKIREFIQAYRTAHPEVFRAISTLMKKNH